MGRSEELADALQQEDASRILGLARLKPGPVVRFLSGRLCSADAGEKWRAVRAIGVIIREPGLLPDPKIEDLLQRFLWALNDESGAVPFGIPEAIGEILAGRPAFRPRVVPLLCGMLTEHETVQSGPIERGVYWAIGRIGADVAQYCPDVARVIADAAAGHPDPETRETAAQTLEAITCP
ncbi:MAG: DVU0298 family protein [Acidobacteriota bacterium]